jgi:hypothetical protein
LFQKSLPLNNKPANAVVVRRVSGFKIIRDRKDSGNRMDVWKLGEVVAGSGWVRPGGGVARVQVVGV